MACLSRAASLASYVVGLRFIAHMESFIVLLEEREVDEGWGTSFCTDGLEGAFTGRLLWIFDLITGWDPADGMIFLFESELPDCVLPSCAAAAGGGGIGGGGMSITCCCCCCLMNCGDKGEEGGFWEDTCCNGGGGIAAGGGMRLTAAAAAGGGMANADLRPSGLWIPDNCFWEGMGAVEAGGGGIVNAKSFPESAFGGLGISKARGSDDADEDAGFLALNADFGKLPASDRLAGAVDMSSGAGPGITMRVPMSTDFEKPCDWVWNRFD